MGPEERKLIDANPDMRPKALAALLLTTGVFFTPKQVSQYRKNMRRRSGAGRDAYNKSRRSEAHKESRRVENMSTEQREARNEKERNMSTEQREARNEKRRVRARARVEEKLADLKEEMRTMAAMEGDAKMAAVGAHCLGVEAKYEEAKAELESDSGKELLAEALRLFEAVWEAQKQAVNPSDTILINAFYSSEADSDKKLDVEGHRPLKEAGVEAKLTIVKLLDTANGHIANALEKEVQRLIMADERADRTFQLTERGYRPGAGAGRVRKSHLQRDFLDPYMKAGLTEEKALLMIKMIRYTLPGQGVALGMAGPELSGAGGSGGASADSPRPSKRLKHTALDELAAELNE